jgi:L-asparagine transporter-like permease
MLKLTFLLDKLLLALMILFAASLAFMQYKFPYGMRECGKLHCDKRGNIISQSFYQEYVFWDKAFMIVAIITLLLLTAKMILSRPENDLAD